MTIFGSKLDELLRLKNLRKQQLAFGIGVEPAHLSKLMRGRAGIPSKAVLDRMCIFLDLSEAQEAELRHWALKAKFSVDIPTDLSDKQAEVVHNLIDSIKDMPDDLVSTLSYLIESKRRIGTQVIR